MRDIGRVTARPRRRPRALTPEERQTWIARLDADPDAVRKDLPDLCAWMLGTGVRIGEALAVSWDEIDVPARRRERLDVAGHAVVVTKCGSSTRSSA